MPARPNDRQRNHLQSPEGKTGTREKSRKGRERPIMKRVAPALGDVPSAAVSVKDLATLDRFAARTHRVSLTDILATGPGPS